MTSPPQFGFIELDFGVERVYEPPKPRLSISTVDLFSPVISVGKIAMGLSRAHHESLAIAVRHLKGNTRM